MFLPFFVAQVLAMIFLAMLILGLRDMLRERAGTRALAAYLPFIVSTVVLVAWAIWLMIRIAPSLEP